MDFTSPERSFDDSQVYTRKGINYLNFVNTIDTA